MPRSKKQKVQEEAGDEEEVPSGDEGSESSISTEMIQADFEAFAPTEKDLGGIRSLLQQLLLKAPINNNELAELIIQQSDIGCVHKVAHDDEETAGEDAMDTDEDVYGLVTLVDLGLNDKECIQQFKAFIQKRYADANSKSPLSDKAQSAFEPIWKSEKSKRIGWVINERLINIPFQIAVPSFESLLEELDASETKFDKFIAVLKTHQLNTSGSGASASAGGPKGKKKKKRQQADAGSDMVIYANSEEELLSEECDCYFDYSVANETEGGVLGERHSDDGFYKPFRRVVLFDRAVFDRFLTKLKSVGNG